MEVGLLGQVVGIMGLRRRVGDMGHQQHSVIGQSTKTYHLCLLSGFSGQFQP